jgi:hypothetical protein
VTSDSCRGRSVRTDNTVALQCRVTCVCGFAGGFSDGLVVSSPSVLIRRVDRVRTGPGTIPGMYSAVPYVCDTTEYVYILILYDIAMLHHNRPVSSPGHYSTVARRLPFQGHICFAQIRLEQSAKRSTLRLSITHTSFPPTEYATNPPPPYHLICNSLLIQ